MTKVLSIDLDYISRPYAEWTHHLFEMNSSKRWSKFMEEIHLIEVIFLLILQI